MSMQMDGPADSTTQRKIEAKAQRLRQLREAFRYTAGKYHDLHHILTPDIPTRPFRDCTNPVCTNAREALGGR